MDWCINFDEDSVAFDYSSGATASDFTNVSGKVHSGMMGAAKTILDDFGVRTAIEKLSTEGYAIKVVGHSLGAGVSVLLAADLRNGFVNNVKAGIMASLPSIRCYAFACPSCVSEDLATAFTNDGIAMCIVNRDDPIPRISRASIMRLADQVIAFQDTADKWMEQDKSDVKTYASTYGRKGHMTGDEEG